MKKITLFTFLVGFLVSINQVNAQCPGCLMNTSLTTPGIYPDTLPAGTQGQTYDEDVTFVMFTDTSGLTVNYFKIVSVTGLPFGLNWQCNNVSNGCQYDPAVSIHGCVKICGTPLQDGHFAIDVGVIANLSIIGNQTSTITVYLDVNPAAGGNAGFTFTPAQSCGTANVSFNSLISGTPNPTSYAWNFGNGNTSTLATPPSQNYSSPGNYVVSLQTQILGYIITGVNVTSLNNNWCGDVEEPSCTFNNPDPYFVIQNSLGSTLHTSNFLSDVQSGSWSGLSIALNNPPYSITIWDDDNVSQDDNLGSFPFNVTGAGTIPFSGAGGTSGNITVATTVIQSFMHYDTIRVLPNPTTAIIAYAPNDSVCGGDTITLTASGFGSDFIQWYNDTTLLIGQNNANYIATQSGNYWALVTNSNGCVSSSAVQTATIVPNPMPPTFLPNGNVLTCFLTGENLQWNLEGTPIAGATGITHTITQSGNYSITATNNFGCVSQSISMFVTYVGIDDLDMLNNLLVYPNPTSSDVTLISSKNIIGYNYYVTDNIGKTILSGLVNDEKTELSLNELQAGLYFLTLEGKGKKTYKIIKK
ncbi:MAG: T9SS type A sorting domain-containing protein [Bacteroidia bacterium]|nr:T9SS type A sorting domain-containing protein [Bacteroidia bacterium]